LSGLQRNRGEIRCFCDVKPRILTRTERTHDDEFQRVKSINRVYTGRYAERYDARRTESEAWRREDAAIRPLLRKIHSGETVLDVAAGTGRWLSAYKDAGARPILLDASEDMLKQAEAKAEELHLEVRLIPQSALSSEPYPSADWVVLTRFLNWIPLAAVASVLRKAIATGAHSVLFTITFEPTELSANQRREIRRRMLLKNIRSLLRLRRKGIYHLHKEADVRSLLSSLGVTIIHEEILREQGRRTVAMLATLPGNEALVLDRNDRP
jgi:SAM-dependent methyltransferase